MKIGSYFVSILTSGFAISRNNPPTEPLGFWSLGVSWKNPAFQFGRIGRDGFGGCMWTWQRGFYRIGVWAKAVAP
jgi:hypothetical protein